MPDDPLDEITEIVVEPTEGSVQGKCNVAGCTCKEFRPGVPTTTCLNCKHQWDKHL